MNAVMLPADLQAWAEAEVAAGRAMTVEQVTERALRGYRSQLDMLRQSLDKAEPEAQASGGHAIDDAIAHIPATFLDEEGYQQRWNVVHSSLANELAEAKAGRVFSANDVFADIKAKLDFARGQITRGETLDGDAFLAELDGWIAQDQAAEPKV